MIGAPDGFIAVSGTDPAVTWTSSDGATWLEGPPSRPSDVADDLQVEWARGLARIGDAIVVAGMATGPQGQPDEEWFSWTGTIQR